MTESIVYCIDSSALIDLRILYRRSTFPRLWSDMTGLVQSGRLIAPRQVWAEIRKDNELPSWARLRDNRRMFLRLEPSAAQVAGNIINQFQGLVDMDKETPDADPFVIAIAITKSREQQDLLNPRRYVVVTSEEPHPHGKPHIPDVCRAMRVDCMFGYRALGDLFEKEGWSY